MIPAHDIDPHTGITEDTISRAAKAFNSVGKDEVVAMFVDEGMPRAVALQAATAGFILATHNLRVHFGLQPSATPEVLQDAGEDEDTQVG